MDHLQNSLFPAPSSPGSGQWEVVPGAVLCGHSRPSGCTNTTTSKDASGREFLLLCLAHPGQPLPMLCSSPRGCPCLGRLGAEPGTGSISCQCFWLPFKASSRLTLRPPGSALCDTNDPPGPRERHCYPCCQGSREVLGGILVHQVPKVLPSWRRQSKAASRAPSTPAGWRRAILGL